jgi:hypothetical protein
MQPAAKLKKLPEPPAELSNDDTVATKLSDIATTNTQNFTTYHLTAEQLEKLQQWIIQQKQLWDKAKKTIQ